MEVRDRSQILLSRSFLPTIVSKQQLQQDIISLDVMVPAHLGRIFIYWEEQWFGVVITLREQSTIDMDDVITTRLTLDGP